MPDRGDDDIPKTRSNWLWIIVFIMLVIIVIAWWVNPTSGSGGNAPSGQATAQPSGFANEPAGGVPVTLPTTQVTSVTGPGAPASGGGASPTTR
jgi:hypothetical protein